MGVTEILTVLTVLEKLLDFGLRDEDLLRDWELHINVKLALVEVLCLIHDRGVNGTNQLTRISRVKADLLGV